MALPWLTAKRSDCPNPQRLPKRDLDTSVKQLPVISENSAFETVRKVSEVLVA